MLIAQQTRDLPVLGHRVGVQHLRRHRLHLPATPLPHHIEVEQRQPLPPLQRLGQHHLLARRLVRHPVLGNLRMGVPDENRIDTRHLLGHQSRRILDVRQLITVRRRTTRTRMRRNDHHIRTQRTQLRHPLRGLLLQAREHHLPLHIRLVPDRDTRIGQPQDRHPHITTVRRAHLLHHIRREGRAQRLRIQSIRTQNRETTLLLELPQRRNAVIELVIAQGRRVIADRVHRLRHRMHRAVRPGDRIDLRIVVRQLRTLNRVTRIDQQSVAPPLLGTHLIHQRRNLGKTHIVVRLVIELRIREVIPVEDIAMQIRGAHHGEGVPLLPAPERLRLRRRGTHGTGQRDTRTRRSGTSQKIPTVERHMFCSPHSSSEPTRVDSGPATTPPNTLTRLRIHHHHLRR